MVKASQLEGNKLDYLQVCRGIAALGVVITHSCRTVKNNINISFSSEYMEKILSISDALGPFSVDFFFVLSGFIIYYVHHEDIGRPGVVGRYIWKRFSRIYPIYWICTLATLGWIFLRPDPANVNYRSIDVIISSILLLPQKIVPVIGVAWSLQYEMIFYVAFGLCILNRKLFVLMIISWPLFIVVNYLSGFPFPLDFLFSHLILEFLLGIIGAICFLEMTIPSPRFLVAAGVGGVCAMFAALNIFDIPVVAKGFAVGTVFAVLIVGLAAVEQYSRACSQRFMVFIGTASYSIYLTHTNAGLLLSKTGVFGWAGNSSDFLICVLFLVLASTAAGIIFHLLIEAPIQAWLGRIKWNQMSSTG